MINSLNIWGSIVFFAALSSGSDRYMRLTQQALLTSLRIVKEVSANSQVEVTLELGSSYEFGCVHMIITIGKGVAMP